LADPWIAAIEHQIQLQGSEVTQEFAQSVCNEMFGPSSGLAVSPYVNKKTQQNLLWYAQATFLSALFALKAPRRALPMPTMSTSMTMSVEEMRRRENVMQNTLLETITRLSQRGYHLVGPAEMDGFLCQKIINSPGPTRYILLDPCYQKGMCLELQGIEDEAIIAKVAADLGITTVQKTVNPRNNNRLLSYILPLPGLEHKIVTDPVQWRLRNNRLQCYLMKAITSLSQFSFEPLTQYGGDSILLRYNPAFKPGRFTLGDSGWWQGQLAIELQGDYDLPLIADVAAKLELAPAKVMLHGKDNFPVGWYVLYCC